MLGTGGPIKNKNGVERQTVLFIISITLLAGRCRKESVNEADKQTTGQSIQIPCLCECTLESLAQRPKPKLQTVHAEH